MNGVYLLHFNQPYQHARHYLGYADDITRRLKDHRKGTGARLTQVLKANRISFRLAATWPGADRHFERRLKNRKNAAKLCPICRFQALIPDLTHDVDFYGGVHD